MLRGRVEWRWWSLLRARRVRSTGRRPEGAGSGGEEKDDCPEGCGGGEEVGVGERALREEDRIECGQGDRGCGNGLAAGGDEGELPCRGEADGGDGTHGDARDEGREGAEFPRGGEIDGRQRRVGVRERAEGDERSGAEEVISRGDVVAGFIPVIGEAQQRPVRSDDGDEDGGEDGPQRDWRPGRSVWFVCFRHAPVYQATAQ